MRDPTVPPARPTRPMPGFAEFVILMAAAMGLVSLSIDNILPAFSEIGASLSVGDPNDLQFLIYCYMMGFAAMQIVYGPLADVVGRKPLLLIGLAIYAAGSLLAIFATSFEMLLAARIIQGMGGAGARVLTLTIIRDRYEGHEMARVMSLIMMVFLVVPVFAPAIGSLFLYLDGWRLIFVSMLVMSSLLALAYALRVPETLKPEYRLPPSATRLLGALRMIVTSRVAMGYSTACGLVFAALMGYIGSSQQILQTDIYKLGPLFPVAFGGLAGVMVIGALSSARLVRRLGMRRMSHLGLVTFAVAGAILVALALGFDGRPPFAAFAAALALALFAFAIAMPSLNAVAMEPLGAVAGTAASFIGAYTTILGAVTGGFIGQHYAGTVTPLALGFLLFGLAALAILAITERGRLFAGPGALPTR